MQLGLVDLIDPRLSGLVAESRAFYAQRGAGRGPSSLEELRRLRATAPAPATSGPPAAVEVVRACSRSVQVRIHEPASGEVAGVFLEIHGGCFSAAGSDVGDRVLADALDLAVVSVDYRLAPEHPWPAAPDDCETAALWLADHAQDRFDTKKLLIGGFSAGATLAMSTLLRLRDRPVAAYGTAVMQFGTYDLSGLTPAGRLISYEYFLDAYAGAAEDRTHPDISPIYADLVGLPPVLIVVGATEEPNRYRPTTPPGSVLSICSARRPTTGSCTSPKMPDRLRAGQPVSRWPALAPVGATSHVDGGPLTQVLPHVRQ